MVAFLIIMLIIVAVLLAWVVGLLMKSPDDGTSFKPVSPYRTEEAEHGIAEELLGKIDKRIDTLRKLIKQADTKIDNISSNSFVLPAEFPEPGGNGHSKAPSYNNRNVTEPEIDNSRKSRIIEMCRRGFSPDEIARSVGAGRAEVDLVLKLAGLMK